MASKIQDLELKKKALEEAISYPRLREDKDTCLIEVQSFTYESVSDKIQNNEKLTNLEGAKMEMILEMIRLLSEYKIKYNVELHNHIVFYWRGLPIMTIKITGDPSNETLNTQANSGRMIYVSVKAYNDELQTYLTDKKISRVVAGTIGGLLLLGGAMFAYGFVKSKVVSD
ncbi:hypothetical protein QKU48_gp0876 [Fadolivirus algeromassiliense]|jgi:hypothetical protein|uniref:Uncharacterized protein n=1 Tax=Fadolivirus FV1/VV64 TaxID=3070911 RepID=A0A7D3UVU7_9VIRU|nr:hypothetical protein QKU48_gp0876 [Fadolivirus algeromassiliense]QKF94334.1 hypothetical protein Fadolivirus_1_876 [Fadolivirus FV1/VV64]